MDPEIVCSICLDDGEMLISDCCKRHFHSVCIAKWLELRSTCPDCRHAGVKIDSYKKAKIPTSTFQAEQPAQPSAPPMPPIVKSFQSPEAVMAVPSAPPLRPTIPKSNQLLQSRTPPLYLLPRTSRLPKFFDILDEKREIKIPQCVCIKYKGVAGDIREPHTEFVILQESELSQMEYIGKTARDVMRRCQPGVPDTITRFGVQGENEDIVAVKRLDLMSIMHAFQDNLNTLRIIGYRAPWL